MSYARQGVLGRLFLIVVCLAALAATCESSEAGTQDKADFSLKPVLLHNEDADGYTAGLSFALSQRSERFSENRNRSGFWSFSLDGTVTENKDRNPDNIVADVGAGLVVNTYRPRVPDFDPTNPDLGLDGPGSTGTDWGRFDFGLKIRYEADQSFDEQNLAAGTEIGYVHTNDRGWWSLVPSCFVAYEWVESLKSEVQDTIQADDDGNPRFRAMLSWKLFLWDRVNAPALRPLGLHADLRYFQMRNSSHELVSADLDDASYAALTLSYSLSQRRPSWMHEVFLRYSDGRLPPNPQDTESVRLGVVISFSGTD